MLCTRYERESFLRLGSSEDLAKYSDCAASLVHRYEREGQRSTIRRA
jgi:hypothetical protein